MTPQLLALLGLAVLVHVLAEHWRFRRALRKAPAPPRLDRYPSVSVIRPARGRDVGDEANYAAALDTGYPGEVETLFVVDDPSDPAGEPIRAALAAHAASGAPGRARLLVAGPPPPGRTGKLNAMMAGLQVARGTLVAFGDSDSRPDREVLRVLVETLVSQPTAGSAFAPVVVANPALTVGDLAYALMINGLYGPTVALAAGPGGELPFIMGQLMLLRREALASVGGLECAEGHLVDDMQIGASLAAAGWRNVLASHPLPLFTGGMDLPTWLKVMRRWLLFQRGGLPLSFTAPQWVRGLEYAFGLLAGVGLVATGHAAAAVPSLLTVVAVGWSMAALHRAFGGAPLSPQHLLVPLLLYLMGALALVSGLLGPGVQWRGRDYALDPRARLEVAPREGVASVARSRP